MVYTKSVLGVETWIYKVFRSEIEESSVSGIWRGRMCGPINLGVICDESSKRTQEGCGIYGWYVGTTVCEEYVIRFFLGIYKQ